MDSLGEGLIRASDLEDIGNELSPAAQAEMAGVLAAEIQERAPALVAELSQLGQSPFPIDLYYDLIDTLAATRRALTPLQSGGGERVFADLNQLEGLLRADNPLGDILAGNMGYTLLHASDTRSIENLLRGKFTYPHAEICTSATQLRDRDGVFRSATKTLETGLVYDPRHALQWFGKDVGSHTREGKRVLLDKHRPYSRTSLQDALTSQEGDRIEAWVDAATTRPSGLVVLDPSHTETVLQMGTHY